MEEVAEKKEMEGIRRNERRRMDTIAKRRHFF